MNKSKYGYWRERDAIIFFSIFSIILLVCSISKIAFATKPKGTGAAELTMQMLLEGIHEELPEELRIKIMKGLYPDIDHHIRALFFRKMQNTDQLCLYNKILKADNERISTTLIDPNRVKIASGGSDGCVRIWDIQTGNLSAVLEGDGRHIFWMEYSLDGRFLATSSEDAIRIWDTETSVCLDTIPMVGEDEFVAGCSFSQGDGVILSVSGEDTIRIWGKGRGAIAPGEPGDMRPAGGYVCLRELQIPGSCINKMALSPSGDRLAYISGDVDHTVTVVDAKRLNKVVYTAAGPEMDVGPIVFSPDGSKIAYGAESSGASHLIIHHLETGLVIRALREDMEGISSISFSADGKKIVCGSNHKIGVFLSDTGECIRIWPGHWGSISSVKFSRDGYQILSGSNDGNLKIWKVFSEKDENVNQTIHKLKGLSSEMLFLLYSIRNSFEVSKSLSRMEQLAMNMYPENHIMAGWYSFMSNFGHLDNDVKDLIRVCFDVREDCRQ